nr:class I SAM-dependent methyltransferase [Pontibacter silvestris]
MSYRLKSFKLHGVHSPFIFNLYRNVILHDGDYYAYSQIETLREKLLQDNSALQITDLGAGSVTGNSVNRKVKELAQNSAKPPKYAQLLFRLANHFQPQVVFDLGTSLGLTTSYLAKACKKASIYSFEGCANISRVAKDNFKQLKLKNIRLIEGNLDTTLMQQLQKIERLDFVFFDGNHRHEPTMCYFNACLQKKHELSVFVVDDIYWSKEMKQAWQEIKKHPEVLQTVDLFFVGLVFFRHQQPKEHFILKF